MIIIVVCNCFVIVVKQIKFEIIKNAYLTTLYMCLIADP